MLMSIRDSSPQATKGAKRLTGPPLNASSLRRETQRQSRWSRIRTSDIGILCPRDAALVAPGSLFGSTIPVEVEVNCGWGNPAIVIVGLPDAAIGESRDRVMTALSNCLFRATRRVA
jgi:hypothetical protein